MDAFKLLSRSTSLRKVAPSFSAATRLPSAGKSENPQLFHNRGADELLLQKAKDTQHGKKRKRDSSQVDTDNENGGDLNDAALDFFSSTPNNDKKKGDSSKKNGTDLRGERDDPEQELAGEPSMNEAERRTILNSHKIKVTDLRHPEDLDPGQERKRKKKKSIPSKKEQKKARRIYPQPLTSFKELRTTYRISRHLAENVAEQGFTVPTEVQLGSLPLLLGSMTEKDEPDLLVVAPTGSGKTLAFLIPVINKIVRHHHERPDEHGILAVIVAPTRELAGQIVNEGRRLLLGTGVKITLMKKGMRVVEREEDDDDDRQSSEKDGNDDSEEEDNNNKAAPPITKSDILVTTPLLLVNALSANGTKPMGTLPLVRNLVLDEADVLLDPLFRQQTLGIWQSCVHRELRTSLWSATVGSNIEELSKSIIRERQESLSPSSSTHPFIRLVVGLKDSAIPNVTHKLIYAATEQGKLLGLRQLLRPVAKDDIRLRAPFLIFTQTIPRAIALHSELMYDIPVEAGGSSRVAVLHSDLSDSRRSEIMKDFRRGEIWVLVTTDLLARGVDFRGINGVVNYDIPNSPAVYVHRVGRTGRAGREGGIAVTYYTKEDIPFVKGIVNIIDVSEKAKKGKGGGVQKWLLDCLPDLSKNDKKELKKHGVKTRQSSSTLAVGGRISTKSGYERQLENKRKGVVAASQRRKLQQDGKESPPP